MAFLRRAEQMLAESQPARLDHQLLLDVLAAQRVPQTAEETDRATELQASEGGEDPLVEVLLGGDGYRQARSQQRGCFSRAEAGRHVNVR